MAPQAPPGSRRFRLMVRGLAAFLLAAVICGPHGGAAESGSPPYVIVTVSGERLSAMEKPVRSGKSATFHAFPGGALTSYPASEIDWGASEDANAPKVTAPTPAVAPPTPKPSLSSVAGSLHLEAPKADTEDNWGKLRRANGKALPVGGNSSYFGDASVAKDLTSTKLLFDGSGCPEKRVAAYGILKNISKKKLRGLKVLVLTRTASGQKKEYIQSPVPPNLAPGGEAELLLYVGCDEVRYGQENVLLVADASGIEEDPTLPDGSNLFEAPGPKPTLAAPPRKTP